MLEGFDTEDLIKRMALYTAKVCLWGSSFQKTGIVYTCITFVGLKEVFTCPSWTSPLLRSWLLQLLVRFIDLDIPKVIVAGAPALPIVV